MGMPKGAKIAQNPKKYNLQIRIDEDTNKLLNTVSTDNNISKSELVRNGILLYTKYIVEGHNRNEQI